MPPIYHFTDYDNLESIFDAGCLQCHRDAPSGVDVGDQAIKGNRQWIDVGCGPGGKVCDYVPFYFATRSPMLFKIKCGGVEGVSSDQSRLVYFVSSTEAAYDADLECVFSDGNAGAYSITTFEDDRQKLASHVDWEVITLRIWRNTDEDPDRRRRRMAEFLIHDSVPLDLITQVGVTDAEVQRGVAAIASEGGWDVAVRRRPGWYFY